MRDVRGRCCKHVMSEYEMHVWDVSDYSTCGQVCQMLSRFARLYWTMPRTVDGKS